MLEQFIPKALWPIKKTTVIQPTVLGVVVRKDGELIFEPVKHNDEVALLNRGQMSHARFVMRYEDHGQAIGVRKSSQKVKSGPKGRLVEEGKPVPFTTWISWANLAARLLTPAQAGERAVQLATTLEGKVPEMVLWVGGESFYPAEMGDKVVRTRYAARSISV